MPLQKFANMIGRTMTSVGVSGAPPYRMMFKAEDESLFFFQHEQDCCEDVHIEDVCGDLKNLIGSPLLEAEEVSSENAPEVKPNRWQDESHTWTFYRFATIKGSVTVRWLGQSNGYYSEDVHYSETLMYSTRAYSPEMLDTMRAEAKELGLDFFTFVAAKIFGVKCADVVKAQRDVVKKELFMYMYRADKSALLGLLRG
jgi:hypothetical protein